MIDIVLDKIKVYKFEEVVVDKKVKFLVDVEEVVCVVSYVCGFECVLFKVFCQGYGLIVEVKKVSLFKGLICVDFDFEDIVEVYEVGGVICFFVLIDILFFQGVKEFLIMVCDVIDLFVLCKDFMYDIYQVVEVCVLGVDCILIIMVFVSDVQVVEFEVVVFEWKMDVLIEVYDGEEFDCVMVLKFLFLGINNCNFKIFEIMFDIICIFVFCVFKDCFVVCESGLFIFEDFVEMFKVNVCIFLIGESFMCQDDVMVVI